MMNCHLKNHCQCQGKVYLILTCILYVTLKKMGFCLQQNVRSSRSGETRTFNTLKSLKKHWQCPTAQPLCYPHLKYSFIETKKIKNPNCMDRLLNHREQEPSRPIWNWEKIKQTYTFRLEYYQHVISFQAPMWRERQEALQWTKWKAVERERQSTALTVIVGGVEGICAKKQRSEGGHYRPFWWGSVLLPQNEGGKPK